MHASLFRCAAIVALFVIDLVSDQLSPWPVTTFGWMSHDALGTAWTLLWPGNYTAGNVIVLSKYTQDPSSQLFYQDHYYYLNGTTAFYQYRGTYNGVYLPFCFIQYTSGDKYAPGYEVLQSGEKLTDGTNFTVLPGKDAGSVYLQYTTRHGIEQVSWYKNTAPGPPNPVVPVIHDAISVPEEENQSWTWHVLEGDFDQEFDHSRPMRPREEL